MSLQVQPFLTPSLKNYQFSWGGENPEFNFGYDQQGNLWRGDTLVEMYQKNMIVKDSPKKIIFLKDGGLLGSIREGFDETWVTVSSYSFNVMAGEEVYGFKDEFFAIRYLHQVMNAAFPDFDYETAPSVPQQYQINLDCPKKDIYLNKLDAFIGYVQEYANGIWFSHSYYYPKTKYQLEALGFINELYAARYLYQVIDWIFYDLVDETIIPPLPWEVK